jgi:hypothetical protein
VPDLDHRDARHHELLGRENPAKSNHHQAGVINHDRHHKPEFADAVGNLIDLALGMLPRVAGIQSEIPYGAIFDLNLEQTRIGRNS